LIIKKLNFFINFKKTRKKILKVSEGKKKGGVPTSEDEKEVKSEGAYLHNCM
jgi:hypothetical protein